ncbi:hypothetical protein RCH06_003539, partial [Polaromonas sp. CG_9.5]|uniref:hypothetical protein n=1 Tax=Polaromonas sp. CG_9.5 TaxID=3071705 RepID=UPI002DF8869F|nr:hypothetical protein [Polaromonas sp. CG_9.5]
MQPSPTRKVAIKNFKWRSSAFPHSRIPAFPHSRIPAFFFLSARSGWACDDREKRDQGERLSERSEFELDPRFAGSAQVARSEAQGPRQPGRLSFAYFSLAKCIDRRHRKHMCGDMGNTWLDSEIGFQRIQIDSHEPV